jgi:hypothetical protein
MFTADVIESAEVFKREALATQHQREEVNPYLKHSDPWYSRDWDWDDDVPF